MRGLFKMKWLECSKCERKFKAGIPIQDGNKGHICNECFEPDIK